MITLAADIGETRIKLALVRQGSLLASTSIKARSAEGLAPQLPRIAGSFHVLAAQAGVALSDWVAVALAFPSLVDPVERRVLTSYRKYEDAPAIDLVPWARDSFDLPLFLENDARLATLADATGVGFHDVVNRYRVGGTGHCTPQGNHFAYAIRSKVLEMLDPKLLPYR